MPVRYIEMKGSLIVLEGPDRCGKTTQCRLLADKLPRARVMHFPDRTTPMGQIVNQYLSSNDSTSLQAIHLLFVANRWELMSEMVAELEAGTTLIVDRYSLSGAVYGAASGLNREWCIAVEQGLLRPDVLILLEIDANEQLVRGGFGEERYERAEFQQLVRDEYSNTDLSDWGRSSIRINVGNASPQNLAGDIHHAVSFALSSIGAQNE